MPVKLSFGRRLGYGLGDFGFNLFFTTASLYLLYYYTDVLGLSPAVGGWIFAGALAWDAVADPFMGYIANRTKSRWGRYRPYLLFGAIPAALSWILMFVPTDFKGTQLTLFVFASHVLFRTLYTVVSMPYLSLTAVMTTDSDERGVLAGFRMICATTCGLLAAFFTLKLVGWLGGGDAMAGFFRTSLLYGGLAVIMFWIVFATSREAVAAPTDAAPPTVAEMGRMLRANRPFWLIGGSILMGMMAGTMFNKTLPYLLKYGYGREDLIGPSLALLTGCVMISIPIWVQVMKRTSKRTVSLAGSTIAIVGYLLFWLIPAGSTNALLGVLAVLGLGGGAGYLTFWAMIPDTVEYGEWRSGVRAEGMIFGLVSFVQKASLGLAVGVLGQLLTAIGYVANRPQSAETLAGMKTMMTVLPLLFVAAGAAFVFFYPLDRRMHGRIVKVVGWRDKRRRKTLGAPLAAEPLPLT